MVADGRVRRRHRAGAARPDVHVHELPQPRLPREGRGHLSTSSPAAGSRWASARGWYEHEWRAYGYGFPPAARAPRHARRGRADHAPGLDRGHRRRFGGKHYQVDGARVCPLPLQEGGIPLWIAGGGEKVTLEIAAKYARYTNFDGTPDGFTHKSELLARALQRRRHRLRRDRPLRQLQRRRSAGTEAEVAGPDAGREGAPRAASSASEKAEGVARRPCAGCPRAARRSRSSRTSRALEKAGLSYGIFNFAEAAYDRSGIELFEREVIPALGGDIR